MLDALSIGEKGFHTCQGSPNTHLFASDVCVLILQLRLSSTSMISLKELAPTKRQGKVVTFGPYSDTPAYAFSPFSVHFENNNPFIRVTKLARELEVSHWGNVYVDEKYYIRYVGLVYTVRKLNLIHGKGRYLLSNDLTVIIQNVLVGPGAMHRQPVRMLQQQHSSLCTAALSCVLCVDHVCSSPQSKTNKQVCRNTHLNKHGMDSKFFVHACTAKQACIALSTVVNSAKYLCCEIGTAACGLVTI